MDWGPVGGFKLGSKICNEVEWILWRKAVCGGGRLMPKIIGS